MTFFSGQILTAAGLNLIQPVQYSADCSSALTLTTGQQDIVGATVTFDTLTANAKYIVMGVFDNDCSVASAGVVSQGRLIIDGALQVGEAHGTIGAVNRTTVTEIWAGTVASAGSHTFKLAGLKTGAGGTCGFAATHTRLVVDIREVPS